MSSFSTTATPFALSRASLADIPEMARLMYACFPPFVRQILMGCQSEEDLPRYVAFLEDELRTHHHAVWVKVVDKASGRIAAASLWKVYPNAGIPADGGDAVMSWLEGEQRAAAEKLVGIMDAAKREANPEGFVRTFFFFLPLHLPSSWTDSSGFASLLADLHICFTSPDFRRQGAGGLMMQWGCDLADVLSVPAWIEASVEGQALYKVHGFLDAKTPPGLGEVTFMRREPKDLNREGGHARV